MTRSKAFGPLFEVFSLTIGLLVGLQSTFSFTYQSWAGKRSSTNLLGAISSILTVLYTSWTLILWFVGVDDVECLIIQVINGMCLSTSNSLAFVSIFVKSEYLNDPMNDSSLKTKIMRSVVALGTLANWIAFISIHALVEGYHVQSPALGGQLRCVWSYEETTYKLRWIIQLLNHALTVGIFVKPLLCQKFLRRSSSLNMGIDEKSQLTTDDSSYTTKVVVVMLMSVFSSVIMTILVILKYDNPSLQIPVFPLTVLDNAGTILSILYTIGMGETTNGKISGRLSVEPACTN
mmetsp:Transcript_9058/g.13529  ORF Transcript_9058/g.13529 Transcript_9058/m.13529 type:complete len:291 (+) Transcript_9058:143-1015(+)|eukprot:CAMPEP_0171455826 /NCGR_PEP_ID=MMETSP0945-20130129/2562_1 /TAXON_ID=109269 /ORGANISM="Vaucheria litorea, Strain CCMP2940" /LENGTH=290 /DNA_ID=CAMNT_0011981137 /DNA_START=80 /DNA_END=952 /DNA_ORIENTATION=-